MNAAARAMTAKDRESVRTIIQGLILAGVLWVGGSIKSQSESIVELRTQVKTLQATLINVPDLTIRVTRLESDVKDLARRQDEDERLRRDTGK